MKGGAFASFRQGEVTATDHLQQPARAAQMESLFRREVARIAERAEQQIEDRQIRVVLCMHTACVMPRVAFRALHDVAQPPWCANVRVLKHGQERHDVGHEHDGFGGETHDHREAHARQRRPAHDIERAEPECAEGIEPFCAMVPLMEESPQRLRAMQAPMPRPRTGLVDEQADRRGRPRGQCGQVDEPKGREPVRPEPGQVVRHHQIDEEHHERTAAPVRNVRQPACGKKRLAHDQNAIDGDDGERDRVQKNLQWSGHGTNSFNGVRSAGVQRTRGLAEPLRRFVQQTGQIGHASRRAPITLCAASARLR